MRYILYITILIISLSCKMRRTTSSSVSNDSIIYIERVQVDTIKFPSDTIYKVFPLTTFLHDTIIEYRQGRASGSVQSKFQSLYITANCDSLERLVLSKQTEIQRLSKTNKEVKEVIKIKKEIPRIYKMSLWFTIIATLYVVGRIVFKIII